MFGNAEEVDTRIWLHASKSDAKKLLIFSPDTDTYHIGITATRSKIYHSMSTTTLLMMHRYPGNGMMVYWLAALAKTV